MTDLKAGFEPCSFDYSLSFVFVIPLEVVGVTKFVVVLVAFVAVAADVVAAAVVLVAGAVVAADADAAVVVAVDTAVVADEHVFS